jgi:hypothetical protein
MLSAPPVLPLGTPDGSEPNVVGPPLPVAPEPITDGGGDRLVVSVPVAAARPSATLLAAQQLSEEADPYARHQQRTLATRAARRQRALRALVDQRRAEREHAAGR